MIFPYSEKVHIENLKRMIKVFYEKKIISLHSMCPATEYFSYLSASFTSDDISESGFRNERTNICKICRSFVGAIDQCPCKSMGEKEALRRTLIELEKKEVTK